MAPNKDGDIGGGERERHQSSLSPLWSGVPVPFLTSTKPSLLGSNQSVTLRQAGGTEWSGCISMCKCVRVLEWWGHIRQAKDEYKQR